MSDEFNKPNDIPFEEQSLVFRLRERARRRRVMDWRKSVQEGKPDRIADLFDEAADELESLRAKYIIALAGKITAEHREVFERLAEDD